MAERKARIRGIAPRFATLLFGAVVRIAMQFLRMSFAHAPPFMYSPYDCSADSGLTSYSPKRSASIMPRVSKRKCFSFSRLQGVYTRCRGRGIWIDFSVVCLLPLSFYAKKKVAERKARIRGGGAKDARVREHMAAPVPPLMYLPL